MAIVTAWLVGQGGTWSKTLDAVNERLAFSGNALGIAPISVDAWNPATIVTNAAFDAFSVAARNCRYVDPTHVQINEDGSDRELIPGSVAITDCTVQVQWQDNTKSTVLTSCKFYAYNGSNPITPPAGVTVCAFERTAAGAINKNRLNDATGKAWSAADGCGGSGAALALGDQVSAATHSFYIGISAKPTVYGQNTSIKFRVEFDVS
jgi:hypothetical protein